MIKVFLLSVFALLFLSCTNTENRDLQDIYVVDLNIRNTALFTPLKNVSISGGLFEKELNTILNQRVLSKEARGVIIREATEAFSTQMDDRFHEGRGIWQGEFWGKWMLSAVATYRYTGNKELLETIRNETEALMATRRADGYIGTYQNSTYVEGNTWNIWCRKYTLWGLLEVYEVLQDEAILLAARGVMDQLMTEVGPGLSEIVNTGNFAGLPSTSILTPLVKLYRITDERKYLDYAVYIVDNWANMPGSPPDIVNKGLTGEPVHLWFPEAGKWTKAYEFISCIEGLLDLYRVLGHEAYFKAAVNIYQAVLENERVITGGIGYHDKLIGAVTMPEGLYEPCDVVYWERLSAKLLALTADQKYADEIERLAYNTLLASFNTEGNWAVRRLGLNEPHLVAPLHCFMQHHHCCVANIPRGLLQLGEVAVMAGSKDNDIYLNLFIPGKYSVTTAGGKNIDFIIDTEYPKDGYIKVLLQSEHPLEATIAIRKPPWAEKAGISVNGSSKHNNWKLKKTWKSGDVIEIVLELQGRVIDLPGNPEYKAIMRGPVVLAKSSQFGQETLEDPLLIDMDEQPLELLRVEGITKLPNLWMQYELTTSRGQVITLCDYASIGKQFDKPADPYDIEMMMKNRVSTSQRVWMQIDN